MNLATLLEGPAVITYRGASFHSRGGAVLSPEASVFPIETDAYGPIGQRSLDNAIALSLTPVGVWTAAVLDVLYRWRDATIGQLVTPVYDISSIDHEDTDVITLLGTAEPRTGCPVKVATFGTLPAGLSAATLYYWGVADKLHTTAADAAAGTNAVAITSAGTGDHRIIEQEPLVIHTYQNRKITFHNAAIVGMPSISFSAVGTLLGGVTFEAFRINDAAWLTANSLYTVTKELLTDTPPTASEIPTQEYSFAWGAAPWDSFKMRGAATLTPSLSLSEISSDGRGLCGRRIQSVGATAGGAPHGMSEEQLLDILGMQGGAVARGLDRARADLEITGTGVFATVYDAAATALPQTFSPSDPRAGSLEWVGARTPGEAAFYVGVEAEA